MRVNEVDTTIGARREWGAELHDPPDWLDGQELDYSALHEPEKCSSTWGDQVASLRVQSP